MVEHSDLEAALALAPGLPPEVEARLRAAVDSFASLRGVGKRPDVSEREAHLLNAIQDAWDEYGHGPTIRELCVEMDVVSTSTVKLMIDNLVEKGYLYRRGSTPRTLRVELDQCA